jgi:hypothetical protein
VNVEERGTEQNGGRNPNIFFAGLRFLREILGWGIVILWFMF